MANEYVIVEKQELVNIADAVREVSGSTATFSVSELSVAASDKILNGSTVSENLDEEISAQDALIEQIQTALDGKIGGIDTSDATATEADIATGKTAYVNGSKLTGTHTCSSSGGSVETCTLHFTDNTNGQYGCKLSVVNNGIIEPSDEIITTTMSNVVCGGVAILESALFSDFLASTVTIGDEMYYGDGAYIAFNIPHSSDVYVVID